MPATNESPENVPNGLAQAAPNPYAPTGWVNPDSDLRLPSGQLCRVRRVSVVAMIKQGIVDDFDTLTSLVTTEHVEKKSKASKPPASSISSVKSLLGDKERLQKVLGMVDMIVMSCVIQPKLHPAPEDESQRKPGLAYIDWVPDEDKNAVMGFVFEGTSDLEPFREEFSKPSDSVDNGADVETKTQ